MIIFQTNIKNITDDNNNQFSVHRLFKVTFIIQLGITIYDEKLTAIKQCFFACFVCGFSFFVKLKNSENFN